MKDRAKNFFKEYEELCKKYNVSLAHEERRGSFILEPYDDINIGWVKWAYIEGYEGCINWDEEEDELERLTKERDEMKTKLEEMIGNENWVLLDDEIFDTMECETVRLATEEEKELRTKIRRTELKMNKYL
jgi:hypothetical protein